MTSYEHSIIRRTYIPKFLQVFSSGYTTCSCKDALRLKREVFVHVTGFSSVGVVHFVERRGGALVAFASYSTRPGDSGSPVFSNCPTCGMTACVVGVHWGSTVSKGKEFNIFTVLPWVGLRAGVDVPEGKGYSSAPDANEPYYEPQYTDRIQREIDDVDARLENKTAHKRKVTVGKRVEKGHVVYKGTTVIGKTQQAVTQAVEKLAMDSDEYKVDDHDRIATAKRLIDVNVEIQAELDFLAKLEREAKNAYSEREQESYQLKIDDSLDRYERLVEEEKKLGARANRIRRDMRAILAQARDSVNPESEVCYDEETQPVVVGPRQSFDSSAVFKPFSGVISCSYEVVKNSIGIKERVETTSTVKGDPDVDYCLPGLNRMHHYCLEHIQAIAEASASRKQPLDLTPTFDMMLGEIPDDCCHPLEFEEFCSTLTGSVGNGSPGPFSRYSTKAQHFNRVYLLDDGPSRFDAVRNGDWSRTQPPAFSCFPKNEPRKKGKRQRMIGLPDFDSFCFLRSWVYGIIEFVNSQHGRKDYWSRIGMSMYAPSLNKTLDSWKFDKLSDGYNIIQDITAADLHLDPVYIRQFLICLHRRIKRVRSDCPPIEKFYEAMFVSEQGYVMILPGQTAFKVPARYAHLISGTYLTGIVNTAVWYALGNFVLRECKVDVVHRDQGGDDSGVLARGKQPDPQDLVRSWAKLGVPAKVQINPGLTGYEFYGREYKFHPTSRVWSFKLKRLWKLAVSFGAAVRDESELIAVYVETCGLMYVDYLSKELVDSVSSIALSRAAYVVSLFQSLYNRGNSFLGPSSAVAAAIVSCSTRETKMSRNFAPKRAANPAKKAQQAKTSNLQNGNGVRAAVTQALSDSKKGMAKGAGNALLRGVASRAPAKLSAEQEALSTAASTYMPELIPDVRVVDSVATGTSTFQTTQRFSFATIANGASYEMVGVVCPFLNDAIFTAATYSAGVVATFAVADNPGYAAATGVYTHFRCVSQSVVVSCITPALNMSSTWAIGCARNSLVNIIGSNYNSLAGTKGWAKGQFAVDEKGQDCRMVRISGDESDKYFVPITDTINTTSSYSAKTVIFFTTTSGTAAGNYELTIVSNWEAIPSLAATQFVTVKQASADPATYERAMSAGAQAASSDPRVVTSPYDSDSSSHKMLGDMAKSAVGALGAVSSGDFVGAAKQAVNALSDLPGSLSEGVDFLASAVGSLFGLTDNAEVFLRSVLFLSSLRDDEVKDVVYSLAKLESTKVLPPIFSQFVINLHKSRFSIRYTVERMPQVVGTSYINADLSETNVDCGIQFRPIGQPTKPIYSASARF